MADRIWPARVPPPVASKARVAPVCTRASVRSWVKLSALLSHTCRAPCPRNSAAWAGERTMLTRPMPSCRQMRLSIWPRLEAAAVCTRAVWPSRRIVSTMPKAVSGLTKHEAPSAAVASSGSRRHWLRGTQRYWAYIAPPMAATFLPSRAWAAAEVPAATTVPAPSLPTGSDCPTGRAQQQALIRGVERRGLDADQHLVLTGHGQGLIHQRNLKLAAGMDQRAQLQRGGRQGVVHRCLRVGWGGSKLQGLSARARLRVSL